MVTTKRLTIYGLAWITWLVLSSIIIGLEYRLAVQKNEAAFNDRVVRLYERMEHIARDTETILEGFSAFLSAIEYADRESASRYARQLMARYPYVHQLGVLLLVKRSELRTFIARQRISWFPRFNVTHLDFRSGRVDEIDKGKPIYLPVIFMEPLLANTKLKLGADLGAESFLRSAINRAMESHSTVASRPFNLLEGPREYALFYPVPDPPKGAIATRKQAFAMLEVNIEVIRNEILPLAGRHDISVFDGDYASDEPKGLLFRIAAPAPDRLEATLFPRLTAERQLQRPGQPFVLRVNKQLTWSDFDTPLFVTTGCTALLSMVLLLIFLSNHYRREDERNSAADRLLHMATHDALTGLPNRTLLADRFNHACTRAQRREVPFAIMFLDLNRFKEVNDNYGHEVGDQLLKFFARLLKGALRSEDTLSRISGDEFVILLEDCSYANAQQIARKIHTTLAHSVFISEIELTLSVSVGIAVYPDDGITMNELLRKADERMYEDKWASEASMTEPEEPREQKCADTLTPTRAIRHHS